MDSDNEVGQFPGLETSKEMPSAQENQEQIQQSRLQTPALISITKRISISSRNLRIILGVSATIILFAGAFLAGSHVNRESTGLGSTSDSDTEILLGRVALSETELRAVVTRNNLSVYWAGPMMDAKYTIYTPKPNVTLVRYLTNGEGLRDALPKFRVIGTYSNEVGVFGAIQDAGKKAGNVGFVNIDGNAVFYVRTRPTNVYMAIQGKDTQIEIFDPGADQAVAVSLFRGLISRIT